MKKSDLDLFEVFKSPNASELKKLLRGRTIRAKHFMRLVNGATMGALGELKCKSICRILPSDVDLDKTISSLFQGTLKPKKISKLAKNIEMQNRHNLHMFYVSEQPCWWAFTFTLNDLWATDRMHWGSPHVHLTSWLSHPGKDHSWILDRFLSVDTPSLPHDFHIRFEGNIGQNMRFG